jgi:DNA-directed RNA polymerase specialized sigma24 family protein
VTATTDRDLDLGAPLREFLLDRIPKAAAKAHRRFPAVPAQDFEQAMWLRVLSSPAKFIKLWGQDRHGIIWAELCREGTRAGREDDRYRKAAKAAADGYSPYDIEFYSTGVLAQILPALVEAEFDVSAAMEKASAGADAAGVHIRSSDPFGGSENYMVVLVDVVAAYNRLPEGMRRLLKTYYGVSQEDTEQGRWDREGLASSMGLTSDALRHRVYRALQRLQDELGGSDPWQ